MKAWTWGGLAALSTLVLWVGLVGAAPRPPAAEEQLPYGQVLVDALGCAGCHTGLPEGRSPRDVAPPLGTDEVPLAPAYVFAYMADPQAIRPDIAPARMPAYRLDERERLALALFVTNERQLRGVDDAFRAAQGRHRDIGREDGRAVFARLGCGGCHLHPGADASPTAPDLRGEGSRVREDWLRGYLEAPTTIRPAGPQPGAGGQMPDFRLGPAETQAIAGFLMTLRAAQVGDWEPQQLSPFSMQKAAVLLRDRWSCLGCHAVGDEGGRVGPRLDGVGERLQAAYVRSVLEDPDHLAPGSIMPASLEQPDRLDLMASFLLHREGRWAAGEVVASDGAADPRGGEPGDGERLYQARCAPCHGTEGRGDGFNAPFLPVPPTVHADSAAMSLRPDDTLYDGIYAGGWILGKSHRMPAFGASLDDGQIRSLVAYIRTLCRCQGPAWSRDGRRRP